MYRPVQIAGYLALVGTAAALLVGSVLGSPEFSTGVIGLQTGLVLTAGVAAVVERERAVADLEGSATGFDESDAADAAAVLGGAVVTFGLHDAGLGPVLASALVGLAVGLAAPRIAVPAYCGSFVGMASPAVFTSVGSVAAAGLIAGVAFVATAESFDGTGGKLGTIAMFGCVATVALTGLEYGAPSDPQWGLAHVVVPVAVAGAVATVVLSVDLEAGAVVGSGLVGVVAGVGLPLAAPELGATLAAVAFCASFVGMSSVDRFATRSRVAVAGALCGLVYLAVTPAFTGTGGKLGTVAFVSCIAVVGAEELWTGVRSRFGVS